MLRLLLISSCNFVRLLFESGYYSRATIIKLRMEDEEIHCLKVEWLQMPGNQSKETLPHLPLQRIPSLRNQTLFADVEEDEAW